VSEVPDRLHVVVCIQQHGRRTTRRRPAADDGGLATAAHDLHIRQPGAAEQLRDCFGGALDMPVIEPIEGNARNAGQELEVGSYAGHFALDGRTQIGFCHV
jgi:hypothetical protein